MRGRCMPGNREIGDRPRFPLRMRRRGQHILIVPAAWAPLCMKTWSVPYFICLFHMRGSPRLTHVSRQFRAGLPRALDERVRKGSAQRCTCELVASSRQWRASTSERGRAAAWFSRGAGRSASSPGGSARDSAAWLGAGVSARCGCAWAAAAASARAASKPILVMSRGASLSFARSNRTTSGK